MFDKQACRANAYQYLQFILQCPFASPDIATLATKLSHMEYFELAVEEKVNILNFLCSEVLESHTFRYLIKLVPLTLFKENTFPNIKKIWRKEVRRNSAKNEWYVRLFTGYLCIQLDKQKKELEMMTAAMKEETKGNGKTEQNGQSQKST